MEKYRVYRIVNGNKPKYYDVADPQEGLLLCDKLANKDLKNKNVSWNVFGLEYFEDGEWLEWYDEIGNSVTDYLDEGSLKIGELK